MPSTCHCLVFLNCQSRTSVRTLRDAKREANANWPRSEFIHKILTERHNRANSSERSDLSALIVAKLSRLEKAHLIPKVARKWHSLH